MPSYLFWLFSTIMLIGGVRGHRVPQPGLQRALGGHLFRRPRRPLHRARAPSSSAIIQILVYTGAIMVLFLFIIMLLDLKDEEKRAEAARRRSPPASASSLAFVVQLIGVLSAHA